MIDVGDTAPEIEAPIATGDVEQFQLSAATEDGPVVLAFFPGAFTSVCQTEMNTFGDRIDEFDAAGARVVGLSRDSPFALNEFREQNDLSFGLVSDLNGDIVDRYEVTTDFDDIGVRDIARRAVFVVNSEGTVTYAWAGDNPGVEPDYDAVLAAAEAAE